ncbi:MAG TPA: hypothetical protein VIW94_05055 [Acidimicrobiia bacterium]
MRRWLVLVIVLSGVTACTSSGSSPEESTTTTLLAATTTLLANPFLDVVEEPSNFAGGDVISVVGLPLEEKAWVGSFPAADIEFFGNLWPVDRLDANLIAVGEAASYLGGPVWELVGQDGREQGYFPQDRTGVLGPTRDITLEVADLVGASADELLASVASTIADLQSQQPIQISQREFGGREVYFDLIGGSDPKTRGQRLRVVVEESGESFTVALVESSIICVAGVDTNGACT